LQTTKQQKISYREHKQQLNYFALSFNPVFLFILKNSTAVKRSAIEADSSDDERPFDADRRAGDGERGDASDHEATGNDFERMMQRKRQENKRYRLDICLKNLLKRMLKLH
jgi:hypothetical protein